MPDSIVVLASMLPRALLCFIIAVMLGWNLSLHRREIIPPIINIICLIAFVFFLGGVGRIIGIGSVIFGWKVAVMMWDLLIDLALLALVVFFGKTFRLSLQYAEHVRLGMAASVPSQGNHAE